MSAIKKTIRALIPEPILRHIVRPIRRRIELSRYAKWLRNYYFGRQLRAIKPILFESGETGGLRHRHVVAALDHVEERSGDVEPALLDVFGDVTAVLVEENRPAQHQLEFQARMLLQPAKEELAAPVVGTARQREADAPPAVARGLRGAGGEECLGHTDAGSWFTTTVFHSQ